MQFYIYPSDHQESLSVIHIIASAQVIYVTLYFTNFS